MRACSRGWATPALVCSALHHSPVHPRSPQAISPRLIGLAVRFLLQAVYEPTVAATAGRSGASGPAPAAHHAAAVSIATGMASQSVSAARHGHAAAWQRDSCWMQQHRTPDGHIQASLAFPSGMKALGDYIHSKGLKFGLY